MSKIIDFHTHIFPDALAGRAIAELSAKAGVPPFTDGTAAGLRASMRAAGIDIAIAMPIATRPKQAHSINKWAAELNAVDGGVISFGTLHPAQEDWAEEIAWLAENGVPGVKFHSDYQDTFVDDPAMIAICRALADAGLIALFHTGVDIGLPPPVHCPPERLARLLDAVPMLTAVAAHMGGFSQWEDVSENLVGRELYLDTSYSLPHMGADKFIEMVRAHGAQRILFATDSPWTGQAEEMAVIRALPLTDEEKAAILGGNAEIVLGC